jgi:hypothetical protein
LMGFGTNCHNKDPPYNLDLLLTYFLIYTVTGLLVLHKNLS